MILEHRRFKTYKIDKRANILEERVSYVKAFCKVGAAFVKCRSKTIEQENYSTLLRPFRK